MILTVVSISQFLNPLSSSVILPSLKVRAPADTQPVQCSVQQSGRVAATAVAMSAGYIIDLNI